MGYRYPRKGAPSSTIYEQNLMMQEDALLQPAKDKANYDYESAPGMTAWQWSQVMSNVWVLENRARAAYYPDTFLSHNQAASSPILDSPSSHSWCSQTNHACDRLQFCNAGKYVRYAAMAATGSERFCLFLHCDKNGMRN